VNDPDSTVIIIRELQDFSRSLKANVRLVTINLLLSFCKQSKGTHQEYIDDLLRISITLLNDENEQVLNTAWDCVDIIIKVTLETEAIDGFSFVRMILGFGSVRITEAFAHCTTSTTCGSIKQSRTRSTCRFMHTEKGLS
jgi:hypothetical protein